MSFRNLDREWDEVLVIDLFSDAERKAHQVSETTTKLLAANGVHQLQISCSRKEHVFEALNLALARTGTRSFIIQFSAHGCSKGIGNNDGLSLVTWAELRGPLAKINQALKGDLIVNMIACEGIEGLKIDDLMDSAAPFYALLGPTRKLEFSEARDLCTNFYTKLLADCEIPRIVKEIILESGEKILWARSSQAMRNETMSIEA